MLMREFQRQDAGPDTPVLACHFIKTMPMKKAALETAGGLLCRLISLWRGVLWTVWGGTNL